MMKLYTCSFIIIVNPIDAHVLPDCGCNTLNQAYLAYGIFRLSKDMSRIRKCTLGHNYTKFVGNRCGTFLLISFIILYVLFCYFLCQNSVYFSIHANFFEYF